MDNFSSKRRLIIGAIILAFLVFAGAVGMWLFNRNTDNRSQAAAEPVAQMKVMSQKDTYGQLVHNIGVDISQTKPGTTVTDFAGFITISSKSFTPPDGGTQPRPSIVQVTSYPRPSGVQISPQPYATKMPVPTAMVVTGGVPVAVTLTPTPSSVLGVSTDEQLAALPPGTEATMYPGRLITKEPPQPEVLLAQSGDGKVRVKGIGQFNSLQNLKAKVTTNEKGYVIEFSAQAATKDLALQKAFISAQPLLAISVSEQFAALSTPVVEKASIRGYLPGLNTVVELTKPIVVSATVAPERPPVVVKTCRVTADCPTGYRCIQPPIPTCAPGRPCPKIAPAWQCVLMPTKVPSRAPTGWWTPTKPVTNVTGRPQIIIKSVQ